MTSVGTEDMSSVAEGRVLLENQFVFQELKNHGEEIREEESWMRNLIRGNTEEESEKHLGGIWEPSGGIWEASGRLEASGGPLNQEVHSLSLKCSQTAATDHSTAEWRR